MKRYGLICAIAWCLMLCGCGSGGSSDSSDSSVTQAHPAALAVAVGSDSLIVSTYGPAYATAVLSATPTGGSPPYAYQWSGAGSTQTALSSTTVAAPTISATVNWGDNFTDTWQVTVSDAAGNTVKAAVKVNYVAPAADGMPAGFSTTPILGTILSDSVATAIVPDAGYYPLNIYLPPGYATAEGKLPIIYATDGVANAPDLTQYNGWEFTDMAHIVETKGLRAIIVGIGGYERRDTDYLPPGATDYYGFVTSELIPYIEAKYQVDSTNRTLSGHSYGGLFAGLAMMMDRPSSRYFANFVSMDGSYFVDQSVIASMQQTLLAVSGGQLPQTTLELSSSTGGNEIYVDWFDQLITPNFGSGNLMRIPNYDTDHLPMFDEAFLASICNIYNLPPGL